MRNHLMTRLLSMLLVVALLVGFVAPASAVVTNGVAFSMTDNSAVSNPLRPQQTEEKTQTVTYDPDDMVRVSIVLWKTPTLQAGFTTKSVASDAAAMSYRTELQENQTAVTARIENALGQNLDVVWNLTLAANLISANVKFGQIETISRIPGVKQVVLETCYQPAEAVSGTVDKPNMTVSTNMTGTTQA